MTLRSIPGTELRVSPICLGTALFGATIDTPAAHALLDAFVERGGNFIDTARTYNDWIPGERGRSESLLGRWMADRANHQRIVISTKGGHPDESGAPRLGARELASDISASLAHLRMPALDLYYLHRDNPATGVEPIIDALNVHVRAGKIKYLGCSNWTTARILAANAYAAASGQAGFAVNQPMWSAAVIDPAAIPDRTLVVMDDEMRAMHRESGMACAPYSAQAGGLFSKMASPLSALRLRFGRESGYPAAPNRKRYRALAAVAAAKSVPVSQIALAYFFAQPFVTVPVVGCRSVDQLLDSLAAVTVSLSPADLATIDAAR